AVVAAPRTAAEGLIEAAKLGGDVSYLMVERVTGKVLAERNSGRPMPPASTLKAITALYALDRLGPDHRFATRLLATGPVAGGRVAGDLILAGGGDPTLSTDDLGDMAAALAAAGVRSVEGRFLVWAGALPYIAQIAGDQPVWVGYNPAVSGLNLNFNRVNFVWQKVEGNLHLGFDARAERFAPVVSMAKMQVVERDLPVFTYATARQEERWTVAAKALNKNGSRWLPVRRPDLYAGDVFRTLASAQGIRLPAVEVATTLPAATALVTHQSQPLRGLLRDMLKFSTNMTAEAIGMAASARVGATSHAQSALAMADWLQERTGIRGAKFVDHSGLGGAARISAAELAVALERLGPAAGLPAILKEIRIKEADLAGGRLPRKVMAKTGTLNFVSGLAGYLITADGQERTFVILAGDTERRDRIPEGEREAPPGMSAWIKRARRLQAQLLAGWS
ncbi:MAG: D-alanyl-D-alanine carboxypeptidase/D-alanyl-D-alanine-endopeptidase, partial [Paracoccaceae bacterium]